MNIQLTPIATVKNLRIAPGDDNWGGVVSEIVLAPEVPEEAFEGIELFSHLEIIYYFDRAGERRGDQAGERNGDQAGEGKIAHARRPRGNADYPLMGIFAQRNKDRPNSIGLTTVELVERRGRMIRVRYLDAIDGTPVLDIKPVFREFMAKTPIRQPEWVSDLTRDYWK
jgi:tRNA-Thr(GGU) m(6)t(6)A37 methyltransferase TsaA